MKLNFLSFQILYFHRFLKYDFDSLCEIVPILSCLSVLNLMALKLVQPLHFWFCSEKTAKLTPILYCQIGTTIKKYTAPLLRITAKYSFIFLTKFFCLFQLKIFLYRSDHFASNIFISCTLNSFKSWRRIYL